MVTGHIQRKLNQKSAYHKHASAPLPHLPAGSYVYAKPPPSSSSKACIQGKVIGSASPRSYLIDSGISLIFRNHIQFQLAPPQHTDDSPYLTTGLHQIFLTIITQLSNSHATTFPGLTKDFSYFLIYSITGTCTNKALSKFPLHSITIPCNTYS